MSDGEGGDGGGDGPRGSVVRTARGWQASFGGQRLPVGCFASAELAWRGLDILRLKSGLDAGLELEGIETELPLEVGPAPAFVRISCNGPACASLEVPVLG